MSDENKMHYIIKSLCMYDDTLFMNSSWHKKISDTQSNSYTLPEWLFAGQQDSHPVSLHTSTTCG